MRVKILLTTPNEYMYPSEVKDLQTAVLTVYGDRPEQKLRCEHGSKTKTDEVM